MGFAPERQLAECEWAILASISNGVEKVVELSLGGHLEAWVAGHRFLDPSMDCFWLVDSAHVDLFDERLGLSVDSLCDGLDLVMVVLGVSHVEKHSAVGGVVLKADLACTLSSPFLDQVASIVALVTVECRVLESQGPAALLVTLKPLSGYLLVLESLDYHTPTNLGCLKRFLDRFSVS